MALAILLLLVLAFVLALVGAFGGTLGRVGPFPLAFALYVLAVILGNPLP